MKASGKSLVALLCVGAGFALARLTAKHPPAFASRPGATSPASASAPGPAVAAPRPAAPRPAASRPLPPATFRDAAGFADYVARLQREHGLEQKFAQWIALSLLARADFDAAFRLAREQDCLSLWAGGAAVVDPAAAARLLRKVPRPENEGATTDLLAALGAIDPAAGVALLRDLPPTSAMAAFWLFERWATTSLEAARAAAAKLEPAAMRRRALAGIFHVWGMTDRRGMVEWAAGQSPAIGRAALRAAYEGADTRDPAEMVALTAEFPHLADWIFIAQVGRGLAGQGADGWDVISQLPPGQLRGQLLMRTGDALAGRDPGAALEILRSLEPEDQAAFLNLSFSHLVPLAPKEMAQLALAGKLPSYGLRESLSAWARTQPHEALAWGVDHIKGTAQLETLSGLFARWAESDPAAARDALGGLPPGLRTALAPSFAEVWATTDPEKALAWAEAQSPFSRDALANSVFRGWANTDPAAAAAAFSRTSLRAALDVVASRFAEKSPAEAVRWASDLAHEGRRNEAISAVMRIWGRQDAEAAANHLASLDRGPFRDAAVANFADSINQLDPATAADWARSIDDAGERERRLRNVVNQWRETDPAAARAFVHQLPAGPLKDNLLRALSP